MSACSSGSVAANATSSNASASNTSLTSDVCGSASATYSVMITGLVFNEQDMIDLSPEERKYFRRCSLVLFYFVL